MHRALLTHTPQLTGGTRAQQLVNHLQVDKDEATKRRNHIQGGGTSRFCGSLDEDKNTVLGRRHQVSENGSALMAGQKITGCSMQLSSAIW